MVEEVEGAWREADYTRFEKSRALRYAWLSFFCFPSFT